jgi:hypothetical protein
MLCARDLSRRPAPARVAWAPDDDDDDVEETAAAHAQTAACALTF